MDEYQSCLAAAGLEIVEAGGCYWQNYKGVLLPAYLPHAIPDGISTSVSRAMEISRAHLARWTEGLDQAVDSQWWFVMRQGEYGQELLSSNTKSKLNRGRRRLEARPISPRELLLKGHEVCRAAVARYGSMEFLPTREAFSARARAAERHPAAMEFWGVFRDSELVAFAENHLQGGGVFMESIWYDPSGLKDYSSYVLMDAVLDEYLVHRKCRYVSDGSRSIYHETGVHDFLVGKFGFRRVPASMHVRYSRSLALGLWASRPLEGLVRKWVARHPYPALRKLAALHFQESIAVTARAR